MNIQIPCLRLQFTIGLPSAALGDFSCAIIGGGHEYALRKNYLLNVITFVLGVPEQHNLKEGNTMPGNYTIFIDETGNCNTETSRMAVVVVPGSPRLLPRNRLHQIWKKETGLSAHAFHATTASLSVKEQLLDALKEELQGLSCNILIFATRPQSVQHRDFYIQLLYQSILRTITSCNPRFNDGFHVILEFKVTINSKILAERLKEEVYRDLKVKVKIDITTADKGSQVFLQVADLIANMGIETGIEQDYLQQNLLYSPPLLDIAEKTLAGGSAIDGSVFYKDTLQSFCSLITALATRDDTSRPLSIPLQRNKEFLSFSAENARESITRLTTAADTANRSRDFSQAIRLAELVLALTDLPGSALRKMDGERLIVRAATVWLKGKNHCGDYRVSSRYVQSAALIAGRHYADPAWYDDCCALFAAKSVAWQNIFSFEKSLFKLKNIVDFFSTSRQSPFTTNTQQLKSRAIASLLGSYSQSLWFFDHQQLFSGTRNNVETDLFNKAISLSTLAEDLYENESDRLQQRLYRAHAWMQDALIGNINKKDSLEEAWGCFPVMVNIEQYVEQLSQKKAWTDPNIVYLATAFLKWLWLGRSHHPHHHLSDVLMKKVANQALTQEVTHPVEQILGYLCLLDLIGSSKCLDMLENAHWGENIVGLIAQMFTAQFYWEKNRRVPDALFGKLESMSRGTSEQRKIAIWLVRLNAFEQLKKMDGSEYRGFGPLTILPFNYC